MPTKMALEVARRIITARYFYYMCVPGANLGFEYMMYDQAMYDLTSGCGPARAVVTEYLATY
jgi:hypothetical protein